MPGPEPRNLAGVYLRKAAGDLAAARLLAESTDLDDAVVGFHGQQAVEKALKAVLATVLTDDPPRVHDINLLLRLLVKNGVDVPPHLTAGRMLNPWALAMRYDDIEDVLDRPATVQVASDTIEWARNRVQCRSVAARTSSARKP